MDRQYFLNQCDQLGIKVSDNGYLITCHYKNILLGHIKDDFESAWSDLFYKRGLIDFFEENISWGKTYIFNHKPAIKLDNGRFEVQFTVQKDLISNLEIRVKLPIMIEQISTENVFISGISKVLTEKIPFTSRTKDLYLVLDELLPLLISAEKTHP